MLRVDGNALTALPALTHPSLYALSADKNHIASLEGFNAAAPLKHLSLSHNRLKDFDALSTQHQHLAIDLLNASHNQLGAGALNGSVSGLSGLSNLRCLAALNLAHNQLNSVAGLELCVNLAYINLRHNSLVSDFAFCWSAFVFRFSLACFCHFLLDLFVCGFVCLW
jgi:Leucine-rich repeat (LRR) protein